ncbi:MAG: hypothetical protein HZA00_05850 [Nitrospinae bacterium]|nr:hypothetical protein [Nitrospinota bacterium]
MRLLFIIMKSWLIDELAHGTVLLTVLWWFIYLQYPEAIIEPLKGVSPFYGVILSAFAVGVFITKYLFMSGYSHLVGELQAEKEGDIQLIQSLREDMARIKEERDRTSEREDSLGKRLEALEKRDIESEMSYMRKKLRSYEDDKRTALNFLIRELKDYLEDIKAVEEDEVLHAADVLQRGIELLQNEVKKGEGSFYEMAVKIAEIREDIFDLAVISLSSAGKQRDIGHQRVSWFDDTNISRLDRRYKFLKVAFHPDRFPSDTLREEAKRYFQEVVQAYSIVREKAGTA